MQAREIVEVSFKVGSNREMLVVRYREAMTIGVESCLEMAELAVEGGVVDVRLVLSGV